MKWTKFISLKRHQTRDKYILIPHSLKKRLNLSISLESFQRNKNIEITTSFPLNGPIFEPFFECTCTLEMMGSIEIVP